ncbi:MAG: glycosyltransferase [Actinobacteria bacterium]|nr:glycosyltransferase [Actinomycetota bacterium]
MTTYGVLSTYPPTQCGLATFSAALVRALRSDEDVVEVVALVDRIDSGFPSEVRHQWVRGEPGGESRAAARLNTNDIVIVQHEYGIFGGADGGEVLDLVRQLHVPVVVVFHTVLEAPTVRQRSILLELSRRCDSVVTMTWTARRRLINQYGVPASRITVIPHGASDIHVRGVKWTPPCGQGAAGSSHVGITRPGQGNRVGHRCDGITARRSSRADLPHRRRNTSEGRSARG